MLYPAAAKPETLSLLKDLMAIEELQHFYLVGGTALALQYGHRLSIDLDFFCHQDYDQNLIKKVVPAGAETFGQSDVFLGMHINNVKVDWVKYPFPLIDELLTIKGIRMATPLEIAAMKLWAIARRGTKKDFVDLFFLLQAFSLEQMMEHFQKKMQDVEPFLIIRSLTYFGDADEDFDPEFLRPASWDDIKATILEHAQAYLNQ